MKRWKELHKIGITGSRRFPQVGNVIIYLEHYIRTFDSIDDIILLSGNAIGVDEAVESLCRKQGIKNLVIPARWLELEKAAGPIRNKQLAYLSDEVIAFWDKKSKGTKQCYDFAKSIGKPVTLFTPRKLRIEIKERYVPKVIIPEMIKGKRIHKTISDAKLDEFFTSYEREAIRIRKSEGYWNEDD